MPKKITILLVLAVFCCLHSPANSRRKDNSEEKIKRGRQPWPPLERYVWWNCEGPQEFLGQLCLLEDLKEEDALKECQRKWSRAWQTTRTVVACRSWRANLFWSFSYGLKKILSCNVCLQLSLRSVCTQTARICFFVSLILFSSLHHSFRLK